jgi:hypothetical protein
LAIATYLVTPSRKKRARLWMLDEIVPEGGNNVELNLTSKKHV